MIIKTLLTLNKGIANTFEDIAGELGITTDFAKHLVHELARMGYLQEYKPSSCACSTEICKYSAGNAGSECCSHELKIWELTEKGKISIQNNLRYNNKINSNNPENITVSLP